MRKSIWEIVRTNSTPSSPQTFRMASQHPPFPTPGRLPLTISRERQYVAHPTHQPSIAPFPGYPPAMRRSRHWVWGILLTWLSYITGTVEQDVRGGIYIPL
jgi:hypothetical protein